MKCKKCNGRGHRSPAHCLRNTKGTFPGENRPCYACNARGVLPPKVRLDSIPGAGPRYIVGPIRIYGEPVQRCREEVTFYGFGSSIPNPGLCPGQVVNGVCEMCGSLQ